MLITVVLKVWQFHKNLKRVHTGSETLFQWPREEGGSDNANPQ